MILFKHLGYVMRANLPVVLGTQGAFHKKELVTSLMIVLMEAMRLQNNVVSVT